jgi:hypothetical protein
MSVLVLVVTMELEFNSAEAVLHGTIQQGVVTHKLQVAE